VLCVDEKTQCQALERTQPVLPMGLGYLEGVTHDYIRHGTTTLFAALNTATGEVITQCKSRHRHQEFLAFLNHVDQDVPTDCVFRGSWTRVSHEAGQVFRAKLDSRSAATQGFLFLL
jgi:transposase